MSEKIGDPLLDYLEELFDFMAKHRGVQLVFPPNFSVYAVEDQRIWIRNFETLILVQPVPLDHLDAETRVEIMPEMPGCIRLFLDGGPRPEIIG